MVLLSGQTPSLVLEACHGWDGGGRRFCLKEGLQGFGKKFLRELLLQTVTVELKLPS